MTLTITKTRLAITILAMALLVPATAFATHTFTDVATDAFYHDAAEWAKANDITTGSPAGNDTFKPLDGVTRGESVVFLNRYDTNIVQPALVALDTALPTMYTAQVDSDCIVRNQSGGLLVVPRAGFDNICEVGFPESIDTCTAHASPALFGMSDAWTIVGTAYADDPPIVMTQLLDATTLRVHQFLSSGSTTPGDDVSFNLTVVCA